MDKITKVAKRDFIRVRKGRIQFDAIGRDDHKQAWIVPLATFSMRMEIINEQQGDYKHYFIDNGRDIEVDGATWMDAESLLMETE